MERIGNSLSVQHQDLEQMLEDATAAARGGDWARYRGRLGVVRAALFEHMGYEEEELFPAMARAGSLATSDLKVLLEEHAHLRMELDTLQAAAPQYDPEGCIAELERITTLQREHHARELAACYPASDRAAAAPPPFLAKTPPRPPDVPAPLDLRGLQPPEPIVRIFEALERAPRTPLRAILPHEPVPLYGLLRERGFSYSGAQRPDGGFEVLIERA